MSGVLQRPVYTLICGSSFAQWRAENEEDLRAWFERCSKYTDGEPASTEDSFEEFCLSQFDSQMLQEEGLPLDPRELEADDDTPYEDQDPYEAIGESPFGLPGGGKSL